MSKSILVESSDMTTIAKQIFGDIVVRAYYSGTKYSHQTENKALSFIYSDIERSQHSNNTIELDDKTIVIEFTNGNKVSFNSSEWGSIEPVTNDSIYKIILETNGDD